LRYELDDEATLKAQRCPCGRGLPLLEPVHGKIRPMLRLPNGHLKSSTGLTMPLNFIGGFRQFQLIQKSADHLLVRLAFDNSWCGDYADRVRQLVHDFFEAPIRVDIEALDRLELPPSGKLQSVIVEPEP
jgi:phenylacetate-CoA ligase